MILVVCLKEKRIHPEGSLVSGKPCKIQVKDKKKLDKGI